MSSMGVDSQVTNFRFDFHSNSDYFDFLQEFQMFCSRIVKDFILLPFIHNFDWFFERVFRVEDYIAFDGYSAFSRPVNSVSFRFTVIAYETAF